MYSYHVFYFPFKWEIRDKQFAVFSQAIALSNINPTLQSHWKSNYNPNGIEAERLYDEKNYYYKFVHPVLYDTGKTDTLIKHFEREEPKKGLCTYRIKTNRKDEIIEYNLKLDSINLNLYSTGVGMLSFYLQNNDYDDFEDILKINQYGRRLFPPFYDDLKFHSQISHGIYISGLSGMESRYNEDFSSYKPDMDWFPAKFIINLIEDLQPDLMATPVIDDRMFVNCWYQNKDLASRFYYRDEEIKRFDYSEREKKQAEKGKEFIYSADWYRYLYVDAGADPTCQNWDMRKQLIDETTYLRWQGAGSIYGITKYSFMLLTDSSDYATNVLSVHMQNVYSRMIELVLMQRATMLKFSDEVTKVSKLNDNNNSLVAQRVGSLYKEYIHFINQMYFPEVTTQDQGKELYDLLLKQFNSESRIKDLDEEISELHGYITLMIDNSRDIKASWLNIIAAIFLPPTLLSGFFGMNSFNDGFDLNHFAGQVALIIASTILTIIILKRKLWVK